MKYGTLIKLIWVAMIIAGIVFWKTHMESEIAAAFIWAYLSVFGLMGLSEHIEENKV